MLKIDGADGVGAKGGGADGQSGQGMEHTRLTHGGKKIPAREQSFYG